VSPPHGGNWTRAISRLRKEFRDRGHAVCDEEVLSTNPSCSQAGIERLQVENASLKQIIQSKNHQGGDNHNVTSLFHLFGLPLPNFPLTFVKLPSGMRKSRQSEAVSLSRRRTCASPLRNSLSLTTPRSNHWLLQSTQVYDSAFRLEVGRGGGPCQIRKFLQRCFFCV